MNAERKILVTGSTGFIGTNLVNRLSGIGFSVRAISRRETGDLSGDTNWRPELSCVDTVIHLAGRAHVMNETETDIDLIYNRINRDATRSLAEQAQQEGVRRLVFVSTSKVMGESGGPFSPQNPPNPTDPYSRSKLEAEKSVQACNGLESVIIRPPLVYGPGVKGNFIRLIRLVDKGLPLPFGGIKNQRSLIGIDNLCEALIAAVDCSEGVYLPADIEKPSTPELVRLIAEPLKRKPLLPSVPPFLLNLAGQVTGRSAAIDRLTENFVVDGILPGWTPKHSMKKQIADTIRWYQARYQQ